MIYQIPTVPQPTQLEGFNFSDREMTDNLLEQNLVNPSIKPWILIAF